MYENDLVCRTPDLGRVIARYDSDETVVMWPGNDHPEEERIDDLVVVVQR